MNQEAKNSRNQIAILCCCLVLLVSLSVILMLNYRAQYINHFEEMKQASFTAYAAGQSAEAYTRVAAYKEQLEDSAAILVQYKLYRHERDLRTTLNQLGEGNKRRMFYLTLEELRAYVPASTFANLEKQLAEGEVVISDVLWFDSLQNYIFGLCVPVDQEGEKCVLICTVEAEELIDLVQIPQTHEVRKQYLVGGDGKILYCDGSKDEIGQNALDILREWGSGEETLAALSEAFASDGSATLSLDVTDKGYYCTSVSLTHNNWNILRILRADSISTVSDNLWTTTLLLFITIIALAIVVGVTIFAQFRRHQRLRAQEQRRYTALSNFSDTVLFEYSFDTDTVTFTPNVMRLLPLDGPVLTRLSTREFETLLPKSVRKFRDALAAMEHSTEDCQLELGFVGTDGKPFWCECQVQALDNGKGPKTLIGKLQDISQSKTKEQKLIEQNRTDPLTGLMNRVGFEKYVMSLLRRGDKGYFFMLDVDNFKRINDTQGHDAGDMVLRRIGRILQEVFRSDDCAGRIGGDEFVIYMRDVPDPGPAKAKAETILSMLKEPSSVECTVSIGIAPSGDVEYEELYKQADSAMYKAKHLGKNQYYVFEENGQAPAAEKPAQENFDA